MEVMIRSVSGFKARGKIAASFFKRLKGLMFTPGLSEGSVILISPCASVHTCFMRFAIDVVYLDGNGTVLKKETMRPWRLGGFVKGAKSVMEMGENESGQLKVGERLYIVKTV